MKNLITIRETNQTERARRIEIQHQAELALILAAHTNLKNENGEKMIYCGTVNGRAIYAPVNNQDC